MTYIEPRAQDSDSTQRVVQYGIRFPDGTEVWAVPGERELFIDPSKDPYRKVNPGLRPGQKFIALVAADGGPRSDSSASFSTIARFAQNYADAAVEAGYFARVEDVPHPELVQRELIVITTPSTVIWKQPRPEED